jgi:hypothetical protein
MLRGLDRFGKWRGAVARRTWFDALWCLYVPPRKQAYDDELEALRPGDLGVRVLTAAT